MARAEGSRGAIRPKRRCEGGVPCYGGLMRAIKFCVYKEAPHYVAQCLNVDVSSFGATVDEAIANLKEAVELYVEDSPDVTFQPIDEVMVGEGLVHG